MGKMEGKGKERKEKKRKGKEIGRRRTRNM